MCLQHLYLQLYLYISVYTLQNYIFIVQQMYTNPTHLDRKHILQK